MSTSERCLRCEREIRPKKRDGGNVAYCTGQGEWDCLCVQAAIVRERERCASICDDEANETSTTTSQRVAQTCAHRIRRGLSVSKGMNNREIAMTIMMRVGSKYLDEIGVAAILDAVDEKLKASGR
jgi:hypothetical protein